MLQVCFNKLTYLLTYLLTGACYSRSLLHRCKKWFKTRQFKKYEWNL